VHNRRVTENVTWCIARFDTQVALTIAGMPALMASGSELSSAREYKATRSPRKDAAGDGRIPSVFHTETSHHEGIVRSSGVVFEGCPKSVIKSLCRVPLSLVRDVLQMYPKDGNSSLMGHRAYDDPEGLTYR
jgi:hypothetical protein